MNSGDILLSGRLSRRGLLTSALIGATALPLAACSPSKPSSVPVSSAASRVTRPEWPNSKLGAGAADSVDSAQFLSLQQLTDWGAEANRIGLRATGSAQHEAYVTKLAERLRQAGVSEVTLEAAPLKRWLATSWSLKVDGKPVADSFYIPYTRSTGPNGVTAPLVYVNNPAAAPDLTGRIAVFTVSQTGLPLSTFGAISYPEGFYSATGDPRTPTSEYVYKRPYLADTTTSVDALIAKGAAGVIGIWDDLSGQWAHQYVPYDGKFRDAPGLWLDKATGTQVKELARSGAKATLTLQATVQDVTTHNVIGYIPGSSDELTMLHTHTDGTNAIEENGPIAIIAAAQYLTRLPRTALNRTVMIFLSTGHFAGGVGIRHWLNQHRHDIVPRITAGLTIEHLGTLELLPAADGTIKKTGRTELGATFSPDSKGMVTPLIAAEKATGITGTIAKPYVKAPTFPAGAVRPDAYPGEGTYFYTFGNIREANFITGPYGLLVADLDTTGMVDYQLLRKQAMTAAITIVAMARSSTIDLQAKASA